MQQSENKLTTEEIIARGYRRVSNSSRTVARIDRPDWVEEVYAKRLMGHGKSELACAVKDFYSGRKIEGFITETVMLEARSAADIYRRTISQDTLVLPLEIYSKIPGSTHDIIGHVP